MGAPVGRTRVDAEVIASGDLEIVGGQYGHLTRAQVKDLSNTQRRRYFRKVKERETKAAVKVRTRKPGQTRAVAPSVIGRAKYSEGAELKIIRK
jgi:hypothetical protein